MGRLLFCTREDLVTVTRRRELSWFSSLSTSLADAFTAMYCVEARVPLKGKNERINQPDRSAAVTLFSVYMLRSWTSWWPPSRLPATTVSIVTDSPVPEVTGAPVSGITSPTFSGEAKVMSH